jgi:hypothetical protein
MRRYTRPTIVAGVVLLVASGCGSVASRVPFAAVQGQPDARATEDAAQCRALAAANARTEREQVVPFAACMVERGYRVSAPIRAGVDHARVAFDSTTPRPATLVEADLRECARQAEDSAARAGRPTTADVAAGVTGGVGAGGLTQVGPHGVSRQLGEDVAGCLTSRGYNAVPAAGG